MSLLLILCLKWGCVVPAPPIRLKVPPERLLLAGIPLFVRKPPTWGYRREEIEPDFQGRRNRRA